VRAQFTKEEHIRTSAPVRSSDQRQIKATILQQFPALEEYIEEIMPKKDSLIMCKCKDNIQVLVGPAPDNEFIFFQCRQGPWLPTLRLLHQYPDILPKFRVDRGAIRFVLSGANIMAPGLTSPGGHMDPVPAESLVGIFAEGKEHALAIGVTTMSSEQIAGDNKGIAVENTHWLKDGMWTLRSLAP
jgi:PUA domain protein